MYLVCQRARQDVKVVIMGQGPDELFAGYRRHIGICYGQYWRCLPKQIRNVVIRTIGLLPNMRLLYRASYSLDVPDRLERYLNVVSVVSPGYLASLFRPGVFSAQNVGALNDIWLDSSEGQEQMDELNGFTFMEIRSTLPDEQLAYGDRMSMAHGLEVRFPYLDLDIIRYVQGLPSSYKIAGLCGKRVHRQVCSQYLPPKVLQARKRGFCASVAQHWFLSSQSSRMSALLNDPSSRMFEYLEPNAVRYVVEQHQCREKNFARLLFNLVVLEEWLRQLDCK
jgi:asparagine synthase (glutamine-hydrolysing)